MNNNNPHGATFSINIAARGPGKFYYRTSSSNFLKADFAASNRCSLLPLFFTASITTPNCSSENTEFVAKATSSAAPGLASSPEELTPFPPPNARRTLPNLRLGVDGRELGVDGGREEALSPTEAE